MRLAPAAMALAGAALVASCSTTPRQGRQNADASAELAKALEGRIAGAPVRCVPGYRTSGMRIIDDQTLLFGTGRTIYLQRPRGGCPGLGTQRNTLVTRLWGTNQLCDGDINRVVDLQSGIGGGACVFGPFVPYTKPKG